MESWDGVFRGHPRGMGGVAVKMDEQAGDTATLTSKVDEQGSDGVHVEEAWEQGESAVEVGR